MVMNADRVINGSYGTLFDGDELLANVQNIQYRVSIGRQDLNPVGDNWTRYKKLNYSGEGTFTLWKADSKWMAKMVTAIAANTVPKATLTVTLADPESIGPGPAASGGVEEVQLFGVKVWEVPGGFNSGEITEEAIQFTFENIKITKLITGDITT